MRRNKMIEKVSIHTDYIKLDQLLKLAGVVGAGSDAKFLITGGFVKVNGDVITMRGKKIITGDMISIEYDGELVVLEVESTEG